MTRISPLAALLALSGGALACPETLDFRPRTLAGSEQVDLCQAYAGKVVLDGNANFLAEPQPGLRASLSLDGVALDYFKPITERYNVAVRGGVLSSSGEVEYAPTAKTVHLQTVSVRGVGSHRCAAAARAWSRSPCAAWRRRRCGSRGRPVRPRSVKYPCMSWVRQVTTCG